jgi:membrane-associated phospholipid phosphatase
VSLLPAALLLAATPSAGAPLPTPFDGIGGHALDAFQGPNLALHATAVASTAALAYGGVDHSVRVAMQHQVAAPAFEAGAVYGGAILPVVVSSGLYLAGVAGQDSTLAGSGSAAMQALFLTFTATVVLKVASARPFPLYGEARDAPDQLEHPERAREFFRGPLDGDLAWPSGHTSAAISVAAALSAYYAESVAVPLIGYPVGLGIGAGMIAADAHWASDVVAGALLGQAIGWTVGSGFRRRQRTKRSGSVSGWMVVPRLDDIRGIGVARSF